MQASYSAGAAGTYDAVQKHSYADACRESKADVCQQVTKPCGVNGTTDHTTEQCRAVWRALNFCLEHIHTGKCEQHAAGNCGFIHAACDRSQVPDGKWQLVVQQVKEWYATRQMEDKKQTKVRFELSDKAKEVRPLPGDVQDHKRPLALPCSKVVVRGAWIY